MKKIEHMIVKFVLTIFVVRAFFAPLQIIKMLTCLTLSETSGIQSVSEVWRWTEFFSLMNFKFWSFSELIRRSLEKEEICWWRFWALVIIDHGNNSNGDELRKWRTWRRIKRSWENICRKTEKELRILKTIDNEFRPQIFDSEPLCSARVTGEVWSWYILYQNGLQQMCSLR